MPLSCFARLSHLSTVRLISLQRGAGRAEWLANSPALPVVDLGDRVDTDHGAFMDTAAIMMNLDLVITSDTAIAHLAGALGVPVWVALPFMPDWRWLLDRSDSPWYPTMRLFRQKAPGDWAGMSRALIAPMPCATQAELLEAFDLPIALMQDAEALERITAELVETKAADRVRYNVDLVAFAECVQGGKSQTCLGPQRGHDKLLAAGSLYRLDKLHVFPRVDRRSVDGREVFEHFAELRDGRLV